MLDGDGAAGVGAEVGLGDLAGKLAGAAGGAGALVAGTPTEGSGLGSVLSNLSLLSSAAGYFGSKDGGLSVSGSTIVGVTITINSVFEWLIFFDLKRAPIMGILAMPGVRL